MAERTLTRRELNRSTLARQLLLERVSLTPLEAIGHLLGLQAQLCNAPYTGLWTRLRSFPRAGLTQLLENRQVVKATLMRSTLHLMTAEDYILFRPVLQAAMSQLLPSVFARQTQGIDSAQFTAILHAYLEERPRTGMELRAKFAELLPGVDNSQRMGDSIRAHLPLVQVFPNGSWNYTGRPAYTEAESWLGRPLADSETGRRSLVLRFLAAFGPASVKDMQNWSGLTRLQEVIDALRPELRTLRDEEGRELFDLPDGLLLPEDQPAPVRFLPEYDNLLLAYDNRRRFLADEHRSAIFTGNGIRATLLIDGFVGGTWKIVRARTGARLVIEPFSPPAPELRRELQAEGEQLMRWWLASESEQFEIQCMPEN